MRLAAALPVLLAAATAHSASLSPLTDDAANLVLAPPTAEAIAAENPPAVTLPGRQPGFHPLVTGAPLSAGWTIPGLLLARHMPAPPAGTGPFLPGR